MAEDVYPRAFERLENPVGRLRLALAVMGMHGCDNDIKLRETIVGEIERAIRGDVAFDAGQQRQPVEPAIQRPDACRVLQRATLSGPK